MINDLIDRILLILENDTDVKRLMRGGAFEKGVSPVPLATRSSLPMIQVTTGSTILSNQESVGGTAPDGSFPTEFQQITLHVILTTRVKANYGGAELNLIKLIDAVYKAIRRNTHLTNTAGNNPLAHHVAIDHISRFEPSRGKDVESATVMLWIKVHDTA